MLDFVIPRGEAGPTGATGATGAVGPKGDQGDPGEAATITIGTVTTGAPGSDAEITNSGTDQNAVFDFVLPRGEEGPQGPEGPEGPEGPQGTAATITIGTVTTGDPGTDAEVTNSGTNEDAVLDFVIPRGEPGTGGTPDVLATVDSSNQTTTANTPLVFNDNPLLLGTSITHTAGSSDITITQNGVYQATAHTVVSVNPGTSIPATLTLHLEENNAAIAGATASHTFAASSETSTLSFSVPFQVTAAPVTLHVVAEEDGFTINNTTLTIIRLGD